MQTRGFAPFAPLAVGALLAACGGGETAPESTPEPVVEATPAPTPEPTPEPTALVPATLVHVVFEEVVAPPPLPSRSPLARPVGVASATVPSADYLRWDHARASVADTVSALESGYGASGALIGLIEWRIRWGEHAEAGEARRWGICALPCVVEDSFVSNSGHFPVNPVTQPRPLFAHRPGATDVEIVSFEGGIDVLHGGASLWATEAGEPASGATEVTVPVLFADGTTKADWSWNATRSLRVVDVREKTYGLQHPADPLPTTTRVLPKMGPRPDVTRHRAVENVPESWAWAEADRLSGGFKVKPSPADVGLRIERIAKQVLWYPTTRQAGEGKAEFGTYVLTQGATALTVSPFPEGADVLGGTKALDGRVVVAAANGYELDQRGQHIAGMLETYNELLPLKDPGDTTPDPWILYSVKEPTGVVPGSAGPRLFALTVDEAADESWSVGQAWARLHLAPHIAARSPAALDFIVWAAAQLSESTPDTSVYMDTFATAGDDVLQVWRDWLVDPALKGAPDPGAFLAFVEGQLPDLAESLRRDLLHRRFTVSPLPTPIEFDEDSLQLTVETDALTADGRIVAITVPEAVAHGAVTLTMTPSGPGSVRWAARIVAERYWQEAASDAGAREYLLNDLGKTRGGPGDVTEEAAPKVPVAPPSQLGAMQRRAEPTPAPKPPSAKQGPSEITVQHTDKPTGRSTVLLFVWGDPGASAAIDVVATATEAPAEDAP
ncbi:MAG: hypothetical protein GY898_32430 [Proteobacteria bacterium]|nr:hypothetical protein [Pseudomonadota bacterium]